MAKQINVILGNDERLNDKALTLRIKTRNQKLWPRDPCTYFKNDPDRPFGDPRTMDRTTYS